MSLDDLRSSVLEVPGVVSLHGGTFGEAGTYLPGKRLPGLRFDGDDVRIHIVLEFGYDVAATASQIRLALARKVLGDVHVVVEDVVEPETTHGMISGQAHEPESDKPA